MRLKDKVVIITGAGRGIGRATTLRFAEEGAYVVVSDIDFDVVQSVADEINMANAAEQQEPKMKALPIHVNVTERASIDAMIKSTLDHFGRIDVLVNNAGIVRDNRLLKMSEKQFDMVIDVNLKAVFNCTQAVAPIMVEQGSGVILNAASVVATYGNFGQTNYVASKAGVIGMTKVWARELGRKGIRVNAVAPGFIKTRLTEEMPDKVLTKLSERIPLGHMGSVYDIANAYVWLASDEASYITGAVIPVDGGIVI